MLLLLSVTGNHSFFLVQSMSSVIKSMYIILHQLATFIRDATQMFDQNGQNTNLLLSGEQVYSHGS